MARYDYILEDVRKLCDYILGYCDMQTGCTSCELNGITLGGDKGNKCPIYVVSMLDIALHDKGVEMRE